jgi:putative ABC transport system substrate-binding protein
MLDRVVALGLVLLAVPFAVGAQPPGKISRVGYVSMAPGPSPRSEALRQGLQALGYVEGQNVVIEARWADGNIDRARRAVFDLVRSHVDVIVTGGPQATRVAKDATTTIPIVMAVDYDPVGAGFVASLAHPGGNITGLSAINPQLSGKRLELLRELVPRLSRVGILWDPIEPNAALYWNETQLAAHALGMHVQSLEIRSPRDLESALRTAAKAHADAVAVLTDPITLYHRTELTGLAAKQRLPAIYSEKLFVEAGGLMSYGANDRELHRRAAVFVDKILKGMSPSDLPIEQPTKFELIINTKTAKALGLTIPPAVLARADQVIQ